MTPTVTRLRKEASHDVASATTLRPPAPRRTEARTHLLAAAFLVALPTIVAGIYLFLFASDQYAVEFRFNLMRANEPLVSMSGGAGGGSPSVASFANAGLSVSQIWDSQTVVQFVRSLDIVDALDEELGFQRLYGEATIDLLSRLGAGASAERKTEYWRGMVEPFFDATTGVISVSVRAFSAADAFAVANTVWRRAEKTVNDMSSRAREDAIAFGEEEVSKAGRRLSDARASVQEFRDKIDTLDPTRLADVDLNLQARQRERLATLQGQYAVMKESAPNSPQLRGMAIEIEAIEAIVKRQQAEMTRSAGTSRTEVPAITATIGGFEAVKFEESFREKLYLLALQFAEQSRIEAMKQQLYLNAFVKPKLPEEPLYPRRFRLLIIVAFVGMAVWGLGSLAIYSIRDHF